MKTQKGFPDRRSFIKSAGSASIATIVVAKGGTALAQTTEHTAPTEGNPYTYAYHWMRSLSRRF
jgi:hypothetical protein